ncbi:NADH-quinone oxidoreductase subunit NuoN [Candidatus Erwinia haradaeae]|uniref:NADH-quinone oxidoreductase subunit N n=1 Tax=Candidatus Erwinia haradaeae TaxID=1922217 RepID=A0A451D9H2_9GAMM|nr:NADH-quinone oxidoreductase subunit NuoN [Candidatus Erwinia haradaeae]VFP82822.1 NADH-quinone oxidoreductase subunit N [Candidatus Erwinia haradaeae]
MIFNYQQFIALLPVFILAFIIVIMMVSIGIKRNHRINATIAIIGLSLVLFSLYFIAKVGVVDLPPLLRVDRPSTFYASLVILVSLLTCLFAYPWLSSIQENREEFYLLLMISTLGGVVLASANHFAALFLSMELMSLPLCGLIGYVFKSHCSSLEAAFKYTILSAIASAFFLFGTALLYANTGTLDFSELGNTIHSSQIVQPLLIAGFCLILVSFCFKLSLVPFHLWTPDVYQGSASPVGMFLASASKIAVFGAFMRLLICASIKNIPGIGAVLSVIAVASMLLGNLMALRQNNIKRVLGYSSIAHFGYILIICIAMQDTKQLLEAVAICIVSYLFSSVGAFGILSLMKMVIVNQDTDLIGSYRGLFWKHPLLAVLITVNMLSLAGMPMTIGFISKFYLLSLGISSHLWSLSGALILGSSIGVYYYLRIIIILYLPPRNFMDYHPLAYSWVSTPRGIVVCFLAACSFVLGVYPQPMIELAQFVVLNA